jgi:hypothetical protein
LASIGSIVLGTGGSFGVEDIVAQTFYQETQRLLKTNEVLHVLPQEKVKYFSPTPPLPSAKNILLPSCLFVTKVFKHNFFLKTFQYCLLP